MSQIVYYFVGVFFICYVIAHGIYSAIKDIEHKLNAINKANLDALEKINSHLYCIYSQINQVRRILEYRYGEPESD